MPADDPLSERVHKAKMVGFKGLLAKAEEHARIYHDHGYPEHRKLAQEKLDEAKSKVKELGP